MINLIPNDNKDIHINIEAVCWVCQECGKEYTFIKDTPCKKCTEIEKKKDRK